MGRMGNPGAIVGGAAIGGSLGSSIGGLIGDNNRGWRGGYRGSAIGNIVGTIAGAAIGNALTAPKPDPIEEYAYVPEVRQGQSHSKFKPRTQTQQQLTQLKLRKIRFIDDNRNHAIDGGESSKIIFEIMNEGRNPVYDVVPIVDGRESETYRHFSYCNDEKKFFRVRVSAIRLQSMPEVS